MIALTQDKREELKAFLSASIENRCTVYTLSKQRELEALRDQIALASLTAIKAPIKLNHSSTLPKFIDGTDKIDSYHCLIHADTNHHKKQDEAYAEAEVMCGVLYTAPPVPEINLPEYLTLSEVGVDEFTSGRIHGWNECLAEIKRLNGLGE